jgi:oligoribonuclease NrnB/cAMP/cGMP phosphodiesterase (DHH superfamily)
MSEKPNLENAPLSVEMLYPGDYWDQDYSEEKRKERVAAETAFQGADVCGVVDADADGLGCEVLLREAFEDASVGVVQAGHRKDMGMTEAVEMAAEHARSDASVVVADLCPDESEVADFATALASFDDVVVLDHHDWSAEAISAIEGVGRFVHDSTRCATQLVRDEFFTSPPAHLDEFADVTADHDLWIKNDPRSDDLSDLQFWGDDDEYVAAARDFGADIAEDEDVQAFLKENRWEKQERIRLAVEGADEDVSHEEWPAVQTGAEWVEVEFDSTEVAVDREWYEDHIQMGPAEEIVADGGDRVMMEIDGPLSVAFLYGEMYASGAGQAAQDAGADVAVIVPPYNKASLRTREETPIGAAVAQELGGGGHPPAAGAKPGIVGRYNDVGFTQHWESKGRQVKAHVLDAIKTVVGASS